MFALNILLPNGYNPAFILFLNLPYIIHYVRVIFSHLYSKIFSWIFNAYIFLII